MAATLTGIHTFLSMDKRSTQHINAAADFQSLRRKIEEELVMLQEGMKPENYDVIREKWHEILKASPPLPQRIHDKTKSEMDTKHKE